MFDPKFLPTPQEIEDGTLLIQTRWSPLDRRNRMCGGQVVPVTTIDLQAMKYRPRGRRGYCIGDVTNEQT